MEIDLTLGGDSSSRLQLPSQHNKPIITRNTSAFDLGLRFNGSHKSVVDGDDDDPDGGAPVLQLGLLLPRPDNGSSENESEDASLGNRLGGGAGVEGERGSDDDENGNTRKKLRLSKEQSAFLEESFKEHNTLNVKQKLELAKHLNLRPRQVEVWFQNRRARTKLRQTEVNCEYLKRCYDALTEENRRLQKEVQELRTLKSAAPFYMQVPATTLTMCPSCERVSSSSSGGGADRDLRPRFFPAPSRNETAAS